MYWTIKLKRYTADKFGVWYVYINEFLKKNSFQRQNKTLYGRPIGVWKRLEFMVIKFRLLTAPINSVSVKRYVNSFVYGTHKFGICEKLRKFLSYSAQMRSVSVRRYVISFVNYIRNVQNFSSNQTAIRGAILEL